MSGYELYILPERKMKNVILFIGCFIVVLLILFLGLLAMCADSWVLGVLTGVSLCEFPRWILPNLTYREDEG